MIADPQSDEFGSGLAVLYGSLQNTLEWKGKESIDPIKMADRVDLLIKQVQDNLRLIAQTKHGNRTEFVFDHLNVRGEFYDAPRKDLKAKMLIKLWIP